jgi:Na+/melibiose symporter-like transporter
VIRFIVGILIYLAAAAIGLGIAALLLSGVTLTTSGFVLAIIIFAVLQALFLPFIGAMADKRDSLLLGSAAGLIATFAALLVTDLITDGLDIKGIGTWIVATLIVWIVGLIAMVLIPFILVKAGVEHARKNRS